MSRIGRTVASGLAAIAAVAGVVVSAEPAAAETVTMNYNCIGVWIPAHVRVLEFTFTAPATAAPGQTVTVTVNRLVDHSRVVSDPVPAGRDHVEVLVKLGGAASGTVWTSQLANPALQAGENWRVENGSVRVTMPASGEVTYSADTWRILPNPGWQCSPKTGEPVPVAARTRVQ